MGNLITLEEYRKRGCGVSLYLTSWATLKACVSLAGKNFKNIRLPKWLTQPANAGDAEVSGLIPGWGRSHGGGNGTHSNIPAWKMPRTEEPGGLQSMGSQELDTI